MRKIKKIFKGQRVLEGAGVIVNRCFGREDVLDFDPFLLLDFFDSGNSEEYINGFPWHPHRGIETVTYLIEGTIVHEDSLGNKGEINNGDCQWMSAGSGILHQEMPKESRYFLGSQLWINLPKDEKMKDPTYRDLKAEDMAIYSNKKEKVRIISGEYKGVKGPVEFNKENPIYLDIELERDTIFNYEAKEGFNYFTIVIDGEVDFEGNKEFLSRGSGVLYELQGKEIKFKSGESKSRVLLIGGKPLKEKIAWAGPIVMNTEEELEEAFKELREGSFIK